MYELNISNQLKNWMYRSGVVETQSKVGYFGVMTCGGRLPSASHFDSYIFTRDARPAPPRPRGKWLPRAPPAPKIFNSAPPRPAPPRKLPRGKNQGKRSYIIKSFWESKTFDQYF